MNYKIIKNVTEIPKLCINCKYFKKNNFYNNTFAKCTKTYMIDVVDGTHKYSYASIAREYECKEKYFEQKEMSEFELFIDSFFKSKP